MKDSIKKFYEYLGSEEELMYYVRINAAWNEEAFNKMKELVREVIKDYADEDYYPKSFILYFMREIPSIINILSYFKAGTEEELLVDYTEETYLSMIAERMEQLEKLRWEFIDSLVDKETRQIIEETRAKCGAGVK